MEKIKFTPQQIKENEKSELIADLVATSTVMDEIWRYHPENPKKMDLVEEYNSLKKIQKDIELELEKLGD